jgi:hypothetical protein
MADPEKKERNAADDEFDAALGALPHDKVPLPPVSAVADLVPHPEADAEFEAALAKKTPEAVMTVGEPEVIKPQAPAEGQAVARGVDAAAGPRETPWYERLLHKADQALQPKAQSFEAPVDSTPDDRAKLAAEQASKTATLPSGKPLNAQNFIEDAGGAAVGAGQGVTGKLVGAGRDAKLVGGLGSLLGLGKTAAPIVENAATQGLTAGLDSADKGNDLNTVANDATRAAAMGAALTGGAQMAGKVSTDANKLADRLMVQTFMTPAQRAVYAAQHGGSDSLAELGANARDAGLYKPTNWLDYLRPTTARRVAENAERVQGVAGKAIDDFENGLVERGVNPDVKVAPISKGLRDAAQERMGGVLDPAAPSDSNTFNKFADAIDGRQPVPSPAPGPQLGMNDAEELAAAQAAKPELSPPRETVPFTDAMKSKRYMADKIKWNQRPGAPGADFSDDAARRFAWSGLKGNIQDSLKDAAEQGQIPKEDLLNYFKANKDFSTAATVQQPAMKMAERAGETGLGLSDLMAGAAMGNPLASLASRTARGALPATLAATTRGAGQAAQGFGQALETGAKMAPIMAAQSRMPDATKAEVEKAANQDLKDQIKNWWSHLLR